MNCHVAAVLPFLNATLASISALIGRVCVCPPLTIGNIQSNIVPRPRGKHSHFHSNLKRRIGNGGAEKRSGIICSLMAASVFHGIISPQKHVSVIIRPSKIDKSSTRLN